MVVSTSTTETFTFILQLPKFFANLKMALVQLSIQMHLEPVVGVHSTLKSSAHLANFHVTIGLRRDLGHLGDQVCLVLLLL